MMLTPPAIVRCEQNLAQPERLKSVVEALCSTSPARTFENHLGLEKSADYITGQFESFGFSVKNQDVVVDGKTYRNLRVHLGPTDGARLVIGAHYDVAGNRPGADDNASGVAGLLELARLLKPVEKSLKRPIELVAFTLEEPPNFGKHTMGSAVHARSLRQENVSVKLMIALDMIGYFRDERNSQFYPSSLLKHIYPDQGNYLGLIGRPRETLLLRKVKNLMKSATDLPTRTLAAPRWVPGVDLSDHRNFWDNNFAAMMVTDTAFMRNPNYHELSDTPETLDYERMAKVVNGMVKVSCDL